ncbi:MAG: PAS domain S-box protein [Ignavibacteriales bacterium]|nr:PAS domain S-box protein [Ignavibacteriales bacterium]
MRDTIVAAIVRTGLRLKERFSRLAPNKNAHPPSDSASFRESFLLALLEHASEFITILNQNGTIVFESPAVMRLLGYKQDELIGKNVFDFIHPEDLPGALGVFRKGIAVPGFTANLRLRFRLKDGSWRLLEVTGTNLLHDPVVRGVVVNSYDITEQERSEREKTLLSHALHSILEAVCITDLEETIIFVNEAFSRIYGYDRNEILGRNIAALRSPRNSPDIIAPIYPATVKGGWHGEIINRRKDGTDFPIYLSTGVIRDEEEKVVALIGVATDITERKKGEEDLRRTLSLLEATLESTADGILVVDREGKIVSLNQQFARMWNIPADILESKMDDRALEFVIGQLKEPEKFLSKVRELYQLPEAESFDMIEFKDGRVFERFSKPQRIGGKSAGRVWSFRDVTGRKDAELARIRSEQQYRSLFEESKDAVYISTPEGKFVDMNPAGLSLFGYNSKEELLAIDIKKDVFVDPAERTGFERELERQGFVKDFESRLKRKTGDVIVVLETASAVRDETGKVVAYRGILRDVTRQKITESALRKSEQRLRDIVEHSTNLFYSHTPDHVLTYVSPQTRLFLDCEPEEALVKWTDFVTDHPVNARGVASTQRAIDTGERQPTYQLELMGKRGRKIWVEVNEAPVVRDGKTVAIVGALTDITERTRAEEGLRKSEDRYRSFFEDDLTGDFISSPSGKILACNPMFAKIFGYDSVEQVLKTPASAFHSSAQSREAFLRLLRERKRLENYELEARRRDGKPVHIIENVIGTFNKEGELIELKGYVFDNTERKRLEEELRQSQKMEGIGTLAGGIAHDFNNILSIIMVSASRLKLQSSDGEGRRKIGEMILQAVERGSGLTKQLLTFARKTEIHFEPIDINEVTRGLVNLLKETFPRVITFNLNLRKDIPLISADRNQLNQALLNLCVNARDAMTNGGMLEVSTLLDDGAKLREIRSDVPLGHYVTISVADTGTGMDKATKERIFEPFFTTKGRGHGTGLGLAVVYGVVKGHNGFIHVESTPNLGTTFQLFFPVIPVEAVPGTKVFEDVEDIEGGSETILFVEDEEDLRFLMELALQSKGYKVIGAGDGLQAVESFRKFGKETDVIVMDLELPQLSGLDALMQMRRLKGKPRILVASGYFDPNVKNKLHAVGIHHFIQKPYTPSVLLRHIRDVLAGK